MKTFVSILAAAVVVTGMTASAGAAPKERDRNGSNGYREDRPCVVTGWTDWALTRPIFKCPDEKEPAHNRRRN